MLLCLHRRDSYILLFIKCQVALSSFFYSEVTAEVAYFTSTQVNIKSGVLFKAFIKMSISFLL